jgi:Putative prokaryotic signal transducing protein
MSLQDPVAIYAAQTNLEAQMLRHVLTQSGIEAYASEDLSGVGIWLGGTVPALFNARVWVNRADAERATAILQEHQQRAYDRSSGDAAAPGQTVEAVCEECGKRSDFASSQRGSVQECPSCGAFMDVGDADLIDDALPGDGDEQIQQRD